MSMNLHDIVRGAIQTNLEDESLTWFRSAGQIVDDEGIATAGYYPGVAVKGSFQSEGDAALHFAGMDGSNSIIKKLYVYADNSPDTRPYSMYRLCTRSGDYFLDKHGQYWYVMAVTEDFSEAGWVSLRVQLQQVTPELNIITPENGGD